MSDSKRIKPGIDVDQLLMVKREQQRRERRRAEHIAQHILQTLMIRPQGRDLILLLGDLDASSNVQYLRSWVRLQLPAFRESDLDLTRDELTRQFRQRLVERTCCTSQGEL